MINREYLLCFTHGWETRILQRQRISARVIWFICPDKLERGYFRDGGHPSCKLLWMAVRGSGKHSLVSCTLAGQRRRPAIRRLQHGVGLRYYVKCGEPEWRRFEGIGWTDAGRHSFSQEVRPECPLSGFTPHTSEPLFINDAGICN